jgi:hypothetical protein
MKCFEASSLVVMRKMRLNVIANWMGPISCGSHLHTPHCLSKTKLLEVAQKGSEGIVPSSPKNVKAASKSTVSCAVRVREPDPVEGMIVKHSVRDFPVFVGGHLKGNTHGVPAAGGPAAISFSRTGSGNIPTPPVLMRHRHALGERHVSFVALIRVAMVKRFGPNMHRGVTKSLSSSVGGNRRPVIVRRVLPDSGPAEGSTVCTIGIRMS